MLPAVAARPAAAANIGLATTRPAAAAADIGLVTAATFTPPGYPQNHPACTGTAHVACWWYVKAKQTSFTAPPVGMQGSFTVERPVVQGDVNLGYHSLAAMYIGTIKNGQINDGVEVGWAVAPVVYTDGEPHLFAFVAKNGSQNAACWPQPSQCGWVAASGTTYHLGDYLQPAYGADIENPFGIVYSGGNWWVNFDNQWIGYFKGSFWGGGFTHGTIVAWYGEVETIDAPDGGGCTYMGDGTYGTQPGSAKIGALGYWTRNASGIHNHWAHPTADNKYGNSIFYNMGNHLKASWFTYGGPGGYVDEYGVSHPCT
jgi:hypothetical protein